MRAEYERANNDAKKQFYEYSNKIRFERNRSAWNNISTEDGENVNRSVGQIRSKRFQIDTTGNNEYLQSGDKRKSIKTIYGIGQKYKDIISIDAKVIGEFITELEDIDYDNKKTFERILKHYSRNVGYVLGRYNSKSGRFNRYGRKVLKNEKSVRQ